MVCGKLQELCSCIDATLVYRKLCVLQSAVSSKCRSKAFILPFSTDSWRYLKLLFLHSHTNTRLWRSIESWWKLWIKLRKQIILWFQEIVCLLIPVVLVLFSFRDFHLICILLATRFRGKLSLALMRSLRKLLVELFHWHVLNLDHWFQIVTVYLTRCFLIWCLQQSSIRLLRHPFDWINGSEWLDI